MSTTSISNPNASSNPNTTPTGVKLRDSCDACASSKLKCHKQKPTCSRCAKRGIQCNYLATRRAGRRTERRRSSLSPPQPSPAAELQLSQLDMQLDAMEWFGTPAANSGTPRGTGDDYFLGPTPELSTGSASIPSSGLNSRPLSPVDYAAMLTNLDDFLQPPPNMWLPDLSTKPEMAGQTDTDFFSLPAFLSNDQNQTTSFFDTNTDFLQVRDDNCAGNVSQKLPGTGNSADKQITQALGCCLIQAMALLQQLFARAENGTVAKGANATRDQTSEMNNHPPLTLSVVLDANKRTMDAVSDIMKCENGCSANGYLLVLISLIAFKVQDSYEAAFANTPQTDANLTPEDDPRYMAAQTVLGELHRVQRLVNQLSTKMKEQNATGQGQGIPATLSVGDGNMVKGCPPLSPCMLSQLEVDMRKRLKRLSCGLVTYMKSD